MRKSTGTRGIILSAGSVCAAAASLLARPVSAGEADAWWASGIVDCGLSGEHVARLGAARAGAPAGPASVGGEGVIVDVLVDVMVVYTPSARVAEGGADAIRAVIDDYVAYANDVYEASGVGHRFRLVEASEVNYAESGNSITDLVRLRDPDDGFMDDVHPLRDARGADLVSLINTSGSAGVAYLMQELGVDFAERAFSAIGVGVGGLVFAHETGHNMGCAHNNGPDAPLTIFCYSFGHRTVDEQWRTIMSSSPGEYVDFFSSPDLEVDGMPLGVSGDGCPADAADNVRSLNGAAETVAQFRPTVIPLCPADVDDSGTVDFGDLLLVLAAWGPCANCPEDVDGDDTVDFGDLLAVLAAWGPCA